MYESSSLNSSPYNISDFQRNSYELRYGNFSDKEVTELANSGDSEAGLYLCLIRYGSDIRRGVIV